jgi:hypothetical protein
MCGTKDAWKLFSNADASHPRKWMTTWFCGNCEKGLVRLTATSFEREEKDGQLIRLGLEEPT